MRLRFKKTVRIFRLKIKNREIIDKIEEEYKKNLELRKIDLFRNHFSNPRSSN